MIRLEHELTQHLEAARRDRSGVTVARRAALGQYFTPLAVAQQMAGYLAPQQEHVRLLDPGAGAGVLLAAATLALCAQPIAPRTLHIVAYELDASLLDTLRHTLALCTAYAAQHGTTLTAQIVHEDVILHTCGQLQNQLFGEAVESFDIAITNPPYRKIGAQSQYARELAKLGVTTTNLYAGFLALASLLLAEGGQLVAITPRSFCNGSYFRNFRRFFLDRMAIEHIHIFESRQHAFADDSVLQENIITVARRTSLPAPNTIISTSIGIAQHAVRSWRVAATHLVHPADPEQMIHLPQDDHSIDVAAAMASLPCTLAQLGLGVSTGPVVDFRLAAHLHAEPTAGAVPLIYPLHVNGGIVWPKSSKKPNSIALNDATRGWLTQRGTYVLVKRISAKEERRRVVATVLHEDDLPGQWFGLENHLNYFHANKRGLDTMLARGLAAYLNSSLVDGYVRQFNGHTQINATDLRALRYPNIQALHTLGIELGNQYNTTNEVDIVLGQILQEAV